MSESYGKETRRKSQGKDSINSISFVYRTLEKQWIFVLNIYVYSKCIYLINRLIDIYTFYHRFIKMESHNDLHSFVQY